jgi:hypothetical protein
MPVAPKAPDPRQCLLPRSSETRAVKPFRRRKPDTWVFLLLWTCFFGWIHARDIRGQVKVAFADGFLPAPTTAEYTPRAGGALARSAVHFPDWDPP